MAEGSKKTLTEALLAAQQDVSKLTFAKDAENPFYHNKYVSLNSIIDKVLPVLHKHNILMSQWVAHDGQQPTLVTAFRIPGSDEVMTSEMLLMLKSNDPQGQGSAVTYARRYSLCAILGIVGDEDDDGQAAQTASPSNNAGSAPVPSDNRPASDAQKKLIMNIIGRKGFPDIDQAATIAANMAGITDFTALTMSQASNVIEQLQGSNQTDLQEYLDEVTT